jgi:hypothetical protein
MENGVQEKQYISGLLEYVFIVIYEKIGFKTCEMICMRFMKGRDTCYTSDLTALDK